MHIIKFKKENFLKLCQNIIIAGKKQDIVSLMSI